jgi:formylglycine-generating enzyme
VYVDGFYMDKYEVTVAQFRSYKPSYQPYFKGCENCPAESVSWEEAKAYCESVGKRLPTEAEWEKAARGGLKGKKYPWGDTISPGQANYDDSGIGKTKPVGSYAPNGYELYDMSGNVWEWCSDWYDANYYNKRPSRNPTGSISGTSRVLRGGSWYWGPYGVRVATRLRLMPGRRSSYLGFRCARN